MQNSGRPLALVTGASSGIGFELAKLAAARGYDLIIAADEPEIQLAAAQLTNSGVEIEALTADLATLEGVDKLIAAAERLGKPVELLIANAGRGLGEAFLDQKVEDWRRVIDTNVTGTLYLVHRIGRSLRARQRGRILIVGSIAGFMPGSYQAVYNGTKALIDSFAAALRNELKDTGVSVTCLMPGPTETRFFERAGLLHSKVGRQKKDDPAEVARLGFDAMMRGDGQIVAGWKNKLQAAMSHLLPAGVLAEQHRKQAQPQRER